MMRLSAEFPVRPVGLVTTSSRFAEIGESADLRCSTSGRQAGCRRVRPAPRDRTGVATGRRRALETAKTGWEGRRCLSWWFGVAPCGPRPGRNRRLHAHKAPNCGIAVRARPCLPKGHTYAILLAGGSGSTVHLFLIKPRTLAPTAPASTSTGQCAGGRMLLQRRAERSPADSLRAVEGDA